MMYVESFFCRYCRNFKNFICKLWLVSFSERNIFFRNFKSITNLNFGLVYLLNDLLYGIDKKSLFFTSLGDFPIDRFFRQFNVETNCCNLGTNFSP